MREILFRGKRVNNGEWVEGYFFRQYGSNEIITANDEIYHVTPETVGQYTGLKDKNGTRIFEGDIVRVRKAVYSVCWCTKYCMFALAIDNDDLSSGVIGINVASAKRIEVIGNIHDNPELLKIS